MMMKKTIVDLALWGILLVLILYLFNLIKEEKSLVKMKDTQLKELQFSSSEDRYKLENITIMSKLQHYAEGRKIVDCTIYKQNEDSLSLSDLCSERKKLFYFFSEQSCAICYIPFLEKLKDIAEVVGKENIILLAKFDKNRSLKAFAEENNITQDIYRMDVDLNIYPEYNDYALAFLLTHNMQIENVIITDKSNVELSNDYLKIIQQRIQNDTNK